MSATDAIEEFEHDHADLNDRVLALATQVRELTPAGDAAGLAAELGEIREELFLHFAREEEGLFPFVSATMPGFDDEIAALQTAHDAVCGALVRMIHVLQREQVTRAAELLEPLLDRFELAYALHAGAERAFLQTVAARLTVEHRAQLAAIVRAL